MHRLLLLLLQDEIVSATACSSPINQPSPAAQQSVSSESHDLPQQPGTASNDLREDAGAEVVSDTGDDGVVAAKPAETGSDDKSAPQEDGIAPTRVITGPAPAPAKAGVEEEDEGEAAPDMADELSRSVGIDGGGQGEQATAIKEDAATIGGLEQAEAGDIAPAAEAVDPDENGGLGAGAKEGLGNGGEVVGSESGDGGTGSGAEAEAAAEVDAERLVDMEIDGASAVAAEDTHGDGIDKPGATAAALELETTSGNDVDGGGVMGGGVAEDFFAGDNSSGDDELYPGAAAASGGAVSTLAAKSADSDQDLETPASEQPPSPRIIASSVQGGFGAAVSTQRNETAGAAREEGLSEAAKAAVAAALANAASATSRRGDDGSKSRKKKKSHKERRRKRSGSRSADEEDPGVSGSRGSGSVGRSEVDGTERTKRSSSRRHHRKSAVG